MLITECAECICRTTKVQRALCLWLDEQYSFFRTQNFCCLSHEAYTCDHDSARGMGKAEPGHLQGVSDTASGLFGKLLQVTINIIMRNKHRIFACEKFRCLLA